jgi:ABC-2 type transport system ATP-binding protein
MPLNRSAAGRARRVAAALTAGAAALTAGAAAVPAAAQAASYSVKALTFNVTVPSETYPYTGTQQCTVDADLYAPSGVSRQSPAPAILTTNGFGGSKADQASMGKEFASLGYVVLSYTGLGFGPNALSPTSNVSGLTSKSGSGCKITLDDPTYDGAAASQLVDFLAGTKAAGDGTKIDYVSHDRRGPIVGTVGGSYGGEFQYAAVEGDVQRYGYSRIRAIVPMITWNDLSYSLAPNNAGADHGVTAYVPGDEKFEWTSLFFADGIGDGAFGFPSDPTRLAGCPNFADEACSSKAQMDSTGAPDATTMAFARHASVESYIRDIRVPTLLMQGQTDTLFNLNESVATYQSLKHRGVPVKLVWQSWGHSGSAPGSGTGELDLSNPTTNVEGRMVLQWFDHYLKHSGPAPALDFSYYRDWVAPAKSGDFAPAYASATGYPAAGGDKLFLSNDGTLQSSAAQAQGGSSQTLVAPAAGAPTSYTETSALDQSQPVTDAPGTTVMFAGAPLKAATDVVGIPTVDLQLSAPVHQLTQQAGSGPLDATLFFRLEDVAPDGTITLVHRLIAPTRVTLVPGSPIHVQLPGIVHRFPAGHHLALVIAAGDAAYRGTNVPGPISIVVDRAHPDVLTVPVVAPAGEMPVTTQLAHSRTTSAAHAARTAGTR